MNEINKYLSFIGRKKMSLARNIPDTITNILIIFNLKYNYLKKFYNIKSNDNHFVLNDIIKNENRQQFIEKLIITLNLYFPEKNILLLSDKINQLEIIEKIFDTNCITCQTYESMEFEEYDIIIFSSPFKKNLENINNKIIIYLFDDFNFLQSYRNHIISQFNHFKLESYDINLY